MFAIPISLAFNVVRERVPAIIGARRLLLILGGMMLCLLVTADGESELKQRSRVNSAARWGEARKDFAAKPADFDVAWGLGQISAVYAGLSTNATLCASIAEIGIVASTSAIRLQSNRVEGHYYLAMNQGELARTKSLGALKLVGGMEKSFKMALAIDGGFDHAGPDRCLGLLYHQAPGWPTSVGSKVKARQHLLRAVEHFPPFPENILNLLEACLDWGDKRTFLKFFQEYSDKLEIFRTEFSDEKWKLDWEDWNRRWEAVGNKGKKWHASSGKQN